MPPGTDNAPRRGRLGRVRLSQFWTLMDGEFGPAYSRVLADRQVLGALSGRTAAEAIEAGVPPKQVWAAICDAMDVPEQRRLGPDRPAAPPGSQD